MAKRNQVTTDLRISADAQLKSSRGFINQLNKIIDKFDFGDKINNQLTGAIGQLKNYNKILEKVQNKSVISDDELKDLVKAGKEIANIVSKTEKLYSNLNTNELNKFSKEYIAKIKAQEEAVAKIKNDYATRTGKNFDKELANYDKLSARVKALEKEKANLIKNGANQIVEKEIDEINKKLETQKTKLKEIQKLQAASSNAYSSTLEKETKKRGYNNFDDLKGVRAQSEEQIRKRLGNAEYKQQSNLLSEINREIKDIEKSKLESNKADKAAISLAKKYKIENVATLNDLKEQVKLKKNNLNQFKDNKSELANAKQVTVELNRQNKLLEDREAIIDAAKQAELKVIQTGSDYKTKASLTAGASATNRQINTLESQLTDTGIEQIANNAANIVANQLSKISGEIDKGNQDLAGIDATNKKLATQSERTADEQDIKTMTSNVKDSLDDTEGTVNNYTNKDNSRIAVQIAKEFNKDKIEKNRLVVNKGLEKLSSEEFGDTEVIDANKQLLRNNIKTLFNQIDSNISGENNFEILGENIKSIINLSQEMQEQFKKELDFRYEAHKKEIEDYEKQTINDKIPKAQRKKAKDSIEKANTEYLNDATNLNNAINATKEIENEFANFGNMLSNNSLHSFTNDMNDLAENTKKAADQASFLGNTFDEFKNKVAYFLSLNYVFDQMVRKVSEAVTTTKEMDKDMTQIGLVLGKTSGQVWKNFDTYSRMAERLNTTTSEVTNSMKLFYQQGLNTSEVNKMVEASAIAAALGESSMAEASETLTSIINSYNLSATQAMEVTDKISQIAIVSAADFGELSTAIEKVASSAASAGLDLDHMMGYLAKMIETTREAPTNIGTALKTIVANFTQFKEDPTQLAVEGSEINKVDKALKSVGISLTNTQGEVRDLSEVLDELGGIWDTLTRSQKSYLATQIAGTRQQSRFYALMNDYGRTLELVSEGSNSAGKAQQQFELYSNSLEASTSRLTNQWQKFFNEITQGNGLVANFNNILTKLMQIINIIGPIGTALGLTGLLKLGRQTINLFANLKNNFDDIDNLKEEFEIKSQVINDTKEYDGAKKKAELFKLEIDYKNKLAKAQKELNKNTLGYSEELINNKKRQKELSEELNNSVGFIDKTKNMFKLTKATGSTMWTSLKIGAKSFGQSLLSLTAKFAPLLIAMVALKAVGKLWEGINKGLRITKEANVEAMENANENAQNIESLSKEYEDLSKKIGRTAEENKRLKEIIEEVTKIDKELGNRISKNTSLYNENIKAMDEYIKQQKQIAAYESNEVAKKEASWWNIFWDSSGFGEGFWADFSANLFGDKTSQDYLKTKRFNNWRTIGENNGQIAGLNDDLQNILNRFTEDYIDKRSNYSAEQVMTLQGEFDKASQDFIKKLQGLSDYQIKNYMNLQKDFEKGEEGLLQHYQKIYKSNLPEDIAKFLTSDVENFYREIVSQLRNNRFIHGENEVQSAGLNAQNLSINTLKSLFNADTSTYSDDEKKNLEKLIADILTKTYTDESGKIKKFSEEYAKAQANGAKSIEKLADELIKLKVITNDEGAALKNLINSTITAADVVESLSKYQSWLSEEWRNGTTSQLKVLEKLVSGELNFGDLNIMPYNYKDAMGNNTGQFLVINKIATVCEKINAFVEQLTNQFTTTQNTLEQLKIEAEDKRYNTTRTINQINSEKDNLKQSFEKNKGLKGKFDTATEGTSSVTITKENTSIRPSTTVPGEMVVEKTYTTQEKPEVNLSPEAINYLKDNIWNGRVDTDIQTGLSKNEKGFYDEKGSRRIDNINSSIGETNYKDYLAAQIKITKEIEKQEKTIKSNVYKKYLEEGAEAAEKYANEFGNIGKEALNYAKDNEAVIAGLQQDISKAKELKETMEKIYKADTQPLEQFTAVFDELNLAGAVDNNLNSYAQALEIATDATQNNHMAVSNLVKQYPQLISAVDATNEGWKFNAQVIEENAQAQIDGQKASLDAKIAGTKAIIAALSTETQAGDEWENATLEQITGAIAYQDSLEQNAGTTAEQVASSLSGETNSYAEWGNSVIDCYRRVSEARNQYLAGLKSKEEFNFTVESNLKGKTITGPANTTEGGGTTQNLTPKKIKEKKNKLLEGLRTENKKGNGDLLSRYNTQLELLQSARSALNGDYGKAASRLKGLGGGSGKSGSSTDKEFDPVLEKLEHFYNYLRQIEKLESKLNKLAEKRNLIDANNNYYIDDLKTENELLKEQQDLYTNYIRDEGEYLAQLRDELKGSAYGDKVYFDEDGLIQVNQTEFSANSEEEQEKLQAFMDLVNEYQNEYNTKLENENKLIQIQVQQLENVKKMYEKVLKRIQDVTTEIERQIELTEHTATMDFSEINQIDYLNTKGGQNVSGILYSETEIAKLQKEIDGINKSVKGLPYSELLEWDEALQQWNVNESKMNDPAIKAKYEALGYTWDQIETSVRSTVTSSQQLNNNLKETVSQANKFRENLKQVLEDSIAGIKDFFSNATDAINGYFSQIERAMDEIDNSNDMFGVDSESLENKYKTLVQSTVLIKQLVEELRRDQKNTENVLTKDFASYVTFINGVAVMNEQAVNNSKTLTKQQQAELKRLIAAYNSAEEQIEELGDKEVEYFQKMLEMEEAKRDAIIELKQQVHDELMARDQEEIDSLQSKYDKMNQLDNEYYNKLQQRVNDARTLREDRQQDNNIAQMQARVSLLQSANGSQYNSELVELQKQLNEALQTQADNDVNRELERIQREQQERQEDRAHTISAMENVLTFKDENNWYWQEAQRIWSEGPESITGYLQSSREYMNISDEQRAQSFENLTTSMNTAFTTLATAEGVTAATSAGTVSNAISALDSSLTSSLNWVNQQLGSGGVIFSNLTNINGSIGQLNADLPVSFKEKMDLLYTNSIGPGIESAEKAIETYLGKDNGLLANTKSIIDSITGANGLASANENGFNKLYNVLMGNTDNSPFSILRQVMEEMNKYLKSDTSVFKYLDKEIAKKQAEEAAKNAKPVTTPPVAKPNPTPTPNTNSPVVNKPKAGSGNGVPEVGDTVKLTGGIFYSQSSGHGDKGNLQNAWTGKQVKITHMNNGAPYPIHISTLGGSALGWLRKEQLSGYKKGGYVDYTGLANVHGTSANPEAFLNAKQTALFETLRDTLIKGANPKTYDNNKEVSKEEYNIGNVNIEVKEIAETNEIEKITKRVKEEIYRDATGHNNMAIRRR